MFRDFSLRARRMSRNKQFDYLDGQNLVPNINDLLSPELLLKIFSYLSDRNEISLRILPVCMLWYKIGNDGSLWKSLEFAQQTISIQKRVMEKIKLKGHFFRSITLKNFQSSDEVEAIINEIIKSCKSSLLEIRMFNCKLNSTMTLANLGKGCSKIRSLCLVRCDSSYRRSNHYRAAYMKDASFLSTFKSLNTLCLFRVLPPASLSFDDAKMITHLGGGSIKHLFLNCDFFGRGIRLIISEMSQTLEGLWLGGTNYNDALCQEISKCIRLRNLCLRQAQNITEIGIKSLGKLNTLEKLMLFNISKLSESSLKFFVMSESDCGFKQSLRYMNLSGAKFYKLGRNNHHDDIDEHDKLILRNTIIACCPNVVHVVIDDELVSLFYFNYHTFW